jgi:hypothetical protein
MLENIDFKLIIAIIATLLTIGAFFPYLRDVFRKRTKPHLYTWLIWAITQGTATVALLYGGGKFGAMSLIIGTMLVIVVLLLSFKYGTKNITRIDTSILILALLAIGVWWQLDSPLLAVFMVSTIDGLGYIPTLRKSFAEPWSETLSFWGIMVIVGALSIIANAEYNLLTITYLATLGIANALVLALCLFRRRVIQEPRRELSHLESLLP